MSEASDLLREAIRNCDRDPVHIPASIQGFGVLIATDAGFDRIAFASDNAGTLFGGTAQALIGAAPADILTASEVHRIRNMLGHETIERQREALPPRRIDGREVHISVHRQGGRPIVELIPARREARDDAGPVEQARAFLGEALDPHKPEPFFDEAAQRLRAMTGYDRVKAYRFLPDGSGEVFAEARRSDIPSFMGLRFPATDIPPIARRLYAHTPLRLLHDIGAENVPLLADTDETAPLDMSLALLRGLDPVHRKYIENMGISGTLTVPVVVDEQLWGLFACHHLTPRVPDAAALAAAELAGRVISLRMQYAAEIRQKDNLFRSAALANAMVVADDSAMSLRTYWPGVRDDLAALVECDGVAVALDAEVFSVGSVPDEVPLTSILTLDEVAEDGVVAFDDLRARLPLAELGDTGGALVVAIDGPVALRVAFLRNLAETAVTWAGAPEKDLVADGDTPRLAPRNSFETYLETVRDKSSPWAASDIEVARALRIALARALDLRTALQANRHRLGLTVRGLNHRVRNILALVTSLSAEAEAGAQSIGDFVRRLQARIVALAGSHALLTDLDVSGSALRDLLAAEFAPYADAGATLVLDGPDVALKADAVAMAALLFHELTTNAVKHGALSEPGGRVEVTWSLDKDGSLSLVWAEHCAQDLTPPMRRGFGMAIIEDSIPYELGGTAEITFGARGILARFVIPGAHISAELVAPRAAGAPRPPAKRGRFRGRALVVEDSFLVARLAQKMLRSAGFGRIDIAATVEEALSSLARNPVDFCLLDLNLRGDPSTEVAERLQQLGVAFAFASGYATESEAAAQTFGVPVLGKPYTEEDLMAVLGELFDQA
ncbi:MAG: HWE histidine kinase domain-containing protein [Pseudomonadota bacterium]